MHSGTVPKTFRNTNVDNQGTNEDDSKSEPHPEAGLFRSQTTQNSGQEVGHYGGYVAVPEHFLQNEEAACINEERTKKA